MSFDILTADFMELALNTVKEGVIITNDEGTILMANQYVAKLFGIRRRELISNNISVLIPKEAKNDHISAFQEFVNGDKQSTSIIKEFKDKNSEVKVIEINISKNEYLDDNFMVVIIKDTTAKMSEEITKLRTIRALAMFRKFTKATIVETNYKYLAKKVCEIIVENEDYIFAWVGYKMGGPEKLVVPIASAGKFDNYLQDIIVRWDGSKQGMGPMGMAIKKKKIQIANDISLQKDYGPWRKKAMASGFYSSVAIPIRENEEVIGAMNIYADISNAFDDEETNLLVELINNLSLGLFNLKQKSIKQKIESLQNISEERYRTLFNESPFAVVITKKSIIQQVNPKFLKLLDYDYSNRIIGKEINDIIKQNTGNSDEQQLEFMSKDHYEHEGIAIKSNGERIPVLITRTQFYINKNPIELAFLQDLTQKIEFEKIIKNQETQLLHSQKMEAIGRLAGNIAHDFNNLLTGILGYVELILDKEPYDQDIVEHGNEIKQLSLKASLLTKQLLTFGKKDINEVKNTDINLIILNMENFWRRLVGESIKFEINLSSSKLLASVDIAKTEQIILNLIVNAKEAINGVGNIILETNYVKIQKIEKTTYETILPGNYVEIIIKDSGCGIDNSIMDKIFEPFFTTKSKGTGLGLSIVFGIVKQFEGHLIIESQVNIGTLVRVLFPNVLEEDEDPVIITADHEIKKKIKRNIMILDDQIPIINVMRKMLVDEFFTLFPFSKPYLAIQEALQIKQRESHLDLLITDLIMPDMSGIEIAKEIISIFPDIKILFISGYTSEFSNEDLKKFVGAKFLLKPFESKELKKKVNELL